MYYTTKSDNTETWMQKDCDKNVFWSCHWFLYIQLR